MKIQVPAAPDADTPKVLKWSIRGVFLSVASATKPFTVTLIGKNWREKLPVREGSRIVVPPKYGSEFLAVEVENADANDTLTAELAYGDIVVDDQTSNRVPPTRLTPLGGVGTIDSGAEIEYDGVRNGRRRKRICIEWTAGAGTIGVYNDGKMIYLLSTSNRVWCEETDANITVLGAAGTYYTGYEVFHL